MLCILLEDLSIRAGITLMQKEVDNAKAALETVGSANYMTTLNNLKEVNKILLDGKQAQKEFYMSVMKKYNLGEFGILGEGNNETD